MSLSALSAFCGQDHCVASLDDSDPKVIAQAIRSQWEAQHEVYGVLDVTLREDDSRIRSAGGAQNIALVRRMCLNLTRLHLKKDLMVGKLGLLALWPKEALGHEAWLLTPDEMARLAVAPIPAVFQEIWPLSGFVVFMVLCSFSMLLLAEVFRKQERRLFSLPLIRAPWIGPLAIRQGLAVMLGLGALGGLPRHGTEFWSVPTLMVPDMQIALAGDEWAWLAYAEFLIALCLFFGLLVRLSSLALMALVGFGFWVFGVPFLAYGPHFLAPALLLLLYGGGALSLDIALRANKAPLATFGQTRTAWTWRLVMFLLGATFVYLGIAYKLNQPTLLIAILEHGDVPTFGLPLDLAALIMMLAELTAGALLALGLLVRPIALFLISAFTFFAVTIGETPLFHANLYGTMFMLLIVGDEGLSSDRCGIKTTIYRRNIPT